MAPPRLLRSLLYVPANNVRFLAKAATLDVDVAVLDLEDSVPPHEKETARQLARDRAPQLASAGMEVFVRMNALGSEWGEEDVRATAQPGVRGFVIPKIDEVAEIHRLDVLLRALEARGERAFELLPLIESPRAVINAFDIARSSPRVVGMVFGAGDFTFQMRLNWSKEGVEYAYARAKIPVDARAAALPAIDSVYPDVDDEAGFASYVGTARRLGYSGITLIHPKQIALANEAFAPTPHEIDWAQRVVGAYATAMEQKRGAILVDGRLVDMVHYKRAQEILDLAAAARRPARTPATG